MKLPVQALLRCADCGQTVGLEVRPGLIEQLDPGKYRFVVVCSCGRKLNHAIEIPARAA